MSTPTPRGYDIGLGDDGDLPVRARFISGLDLIAQRVGRRLRAFYGEWFADLQFGLPFFDWIAQKPPRVAEIGALVRLAIETTPGVVRVDDWLGDLDRDTRTLTYSGTIRTELGDVVATLLPLGDPGAGNRQPAYRLLLRPRRIAPAS